jgi:hypothetical protein
MITLICTGTLFSDWRRIQDQLFQHKTENLPISVELTKLSVKICKEHFHNPNELSWAAFSPDDTYLNKAKRIMSSLENNSFYAWADTNSCLSLNFWQAAANDAKFLLFYSSPEHELSKYIHSHPFDEKEIEGVIAAWETRTRAMFTFFMNNREQCLLVNVESAGSESGPFVQKLNEQFDLDLEPGSAVDSQRSGSSALMEYLATTLLLNNQFVSEIYDEVRSAATVLRRQDKSIPGIEERSKSLINAYLHELAALMHLATSRQELEDELSLGQLQIEQMAEELEFYVQKNREQENITRVFADYLGNDPLLKVARKVRLS